MMTVVLMDRLNLRTFPLLWENLETFQQNDFLIMSFESSSLKIA